MQVRIPGILNYERGRCGSSNNTDLYGYGFDHIAALLLAGQVDSLSFDVSYVMARCTSACLQSAFLGL